MKYFLLIPCLILCSCFSEKGAEPENSSSSCSLFNFVYISSSSSSVEQDPLILECPPEDIAEYPVSEPNPWLNPCELPPAGWVGMSLKLSVEELLFGKQGGVRCVTASLGFLYASGGFESDCLPENVIVSDTINIPPTFINMTKFKREVCPWLIATKLSDGRTLHISVNENEANEEREMRMYVSIGNGYSSFKITQSVD
jgi:hypothetical protein